jgi:hypothetical protein
LIADDHRGAQVIGGDRERLRLQLQTACVFGRGVITSAMLIVAGAITVALAAAQLAVLHVDPVQRGVAAHRDEQPLGITSFHASGALPQHDVGRERADLGNAADERFLIDGRAATRKEQLLVGRALAVSLTRRAASLGHAQAVVADALALRARRTVLIGRAAQR